MIAAVRRFNCRTAAKGMNAFEIDEPARGRARVEGELQAWLWVRL